MGWWRIQGFAGGVSDIYHAEILQKCPHRFLCGDAIVCTMAGHIGKFTDK